MALKFLNNGYFAGKVGIGTASPSSILELAGTTPILTLSSTAVNVAQGIEWRNSGTLDAYIKQGPSTAEFEFNVGRNTTWGGDFKFVTDTYDAYRITRNQHKFFILGSAKMTIDGVGNVGIGTTSPNYKLTAYGSSTDSEIVASFGSANDQNEYTAIGLSGFIASNGATKAGLALKRTATYGTGELHFLNNNTLDNSDMTLSDSKMMINGAGNVGIGTTSPTAPLHIEGGTNSEVLKIEADSNPFVRWVENGTNVGFLQFLGDNAYLSNMSNGSFFFRTNNTDKMTILAGGNVGIGTTSPISKFTVTGTDNTNQANIGHSTQSVFIKVNGTNVDYNSSGNSGGSHTFSTGNVERMRIEVGGNVGIGTTAPTTKLNVSGSIAVSSGSYLSFIDSNLNYNKIGRNTSVGGIQITTGGNATMNLLDNGNVGIGTTSPTQKLHVNGNLRITGAYYDSNNSPGTANQVLVSTVTGTDWIDGSAIPGVPAGSGTLNTVAMWTPDGDTLGDSPITISGNNATFAGTVQATSYKIGGVTVLQGTSTVTVGSGGGTGKVQLNTTSGVGLILDGSNVGIGTTSPITKVHVFEAGTAMIRVDSGATSPYKAGIEFLRSSINGGRIYNDGGAVQVKLESDFAYDAANPTRGGFMFKTAPVTSATLVDAVRIDARGYVGIGTTSPEEKLKVIGSVLISNNEFYKVENTTGTNYKIAGLTNGNMIQIGAIDYTSAGTIFAGGDNVSITTGGASGSTRIKIASSGNVGIGTTSPNHKLDIYSNENVPLRIHRPNNANLNSDGAWGIGFSTRGDAVTSTTDTRSGIFSYYNGNLFLATNNTRIDQDPFDYARLTILSGGNVGIGTTSPSVQLDIEDSSNVIVDMNTTTANANTTIRLQESGSVKATIGYDGTNDGLILTTGGFTAGNGIFIDDSQNVGIGTASPDRKLHVNSGSTNIVATFESTDATAAISLQDNSTTNDSKVQIRAIGDDFNIVAGGSQRVTVNSSGNVGIGTTSPAYKLDVESSATPLHLNRTGGATALIGLDINGTNRGLLGATTTAAFVSYSTAAAPLVTVANTGGVQFNTYGAGTLVTDASGNITVSSGGGAGGPYLPLSAGSGFPLTGNLFINNGFTLSWGADTTKIAGSSSTNELSLKTASTTRMLINSTGNVGIGTTSPSTRFEVAASATASVDIAHFSNSNDVVKIKHALDGVGSGRVSIFDASNNEDVRLSAQSNSWFNAGNVGIGTDNPGTKLEIEKADATTYVSSTFAQNILRLQNTSATDNSFAAISFAVNNANSATGNASILAFSTATDSSAGLRFQTRDGGIYKEPLHITPSGTIGINKTNPSEVYQVDMKRDMTDPDTAGYAMRIDTNISGTKSAATDITQGALFLDTDSTAIGTTTDEHRVVGINNDVRYSGLPDAVYGTQSRVESNSTQTGQSTTVTSAYNIAQSDGGANHTISHLSGTYNLTQLQDNSTVSTAYGTRSLVQANANRATNASVMYGSYVELDLDSTNSINYGGLHGYRAVIDNNQALASELSDTYLFRGSYNGVRTDGNCWGLYVAGDKHYLEKRLFVGTTTPDTDSIMQVMGTDAERYVRFKTSNNEKRFNFYIGGTGNGSRLSMFDHDGTTEGVRLQAAATGNNHVLGQFGVGVTSPQSKLQVAGGIQMADDTDAASAAKVGTMRYRTGTEYVEVTGTELVTNGDFTTDTGWTKGVGWSISGGKASSDGSQTGNSFMYQSGGLSPSYPKWYKIVFTISNYSSGTVGPNIGGYQNSLTSGNGEKTIYLNITNVNSNNLLYMQATATFVGSVDNFSVMEVTEEDASYADMCMQTGSSTYEWVNIVRNTY